MRVQSIKSFQIAFGALSVLTALFTLVALLTPGWRHVSAEGSKTFLGLQQSIRYSFDLSLGLFGFLCSQDLHMDSLDVGGSTQNSSTRQNSGSSYIFTPDVCKDWADKKLGFETLVAVLLLLASLICLLAFLWDLLLLLDKAPDWKRARWLLCPLACLATLLLAVAIIVYAVRGCMDNEGNLPGWANTNCAFGFSFVLTIIAAILALIASVVGAIVLLLNKRIVQGSNNYWN